MTKTSILLGLTLIFVHACTTPLTREQELALYRTRCLEYGYQPGTTEFAQCVENQERQAQEHALKERQLRAQERESHLKKREHSLREKESATSTLKVNLW